MGRTIRRVVAALAIAAAASFAVPTSAPAGADTVCWGSYRYAFKHVIKVDGNRVADLWVHVRMKDGKVSVTCLVLQAIAYRGTPKQMYVDACSMYGTVYLDCPDSDGGRFSYYAGPVYLYGNKVAGTHVRMRRPNGRLLFERNIRHANCGPGTPFRCG
jgi:hypothetical protein